MCELRVRPSLGFGRGWDSSSDIVTLSDLRLPGLGPRLFRSLAKSKPVSQDELRSLFEAARWAPSSYNEQPWRYVVATRDDRAQFERLRSEERRVGKEC